MLAKISLQENYFATYFTLNLFQFGKIDLYNIYLSHLVIKIMK